MATPRNTRVARLPVSAATVTTRPPTVPAAVLPIVPVVLVLVPSSPVLVRPLPLSFPSVSVLPAAVLPSPAVLRAAPVAAATPSTALAAPTATSAAPVSLHATAALLLVIPTTHLPAAHRHAARHWLPLHPLVPPLPLLLHWHALLHHAHLLLLLLHRTAAPTLWVHLALHHHHIALHHWALCRHRRGRNSDGAKAALQ